MLPVWWIKMNINIGRMQFTLEFPYAPWQRAIRFKVQGHRIYNHSIERGVYVARACCIVIRLRLSNGFFWRFRPRLYLHRTIQCDTLGPYLPAPISCRLANLMYRKIAYDITTCLARLQTHKYYSFTSDALQICHLLVWANYRVLQFGV